MSIIPYIIEPTTKGERTIDIYSRLLRERTVVLSGEIDDDMSSSIVAQLLYLESNNPDKKIRMLINSAGGSITSGMSIYDTMQLINPEIETVITGLAASMASIISQSGSPGKRFIMKNARLMIHQPLGSVSGSVSDTEITYKEMLYYKNRIAEIYQEHNSKGYGKDYFMNIMERDAYFGAQGAIELGVVDSIMEKRPLYG